MGITQEQIDELNRTPFPLPDGAELMTPAEVSTALRVPTKTLAHWRATNTGPPSIKVGGSTRYPAAEFRAWLATQMAQTRRGDEVSA